MSGAGEPLTPEVCGEGGRCILAKGHLDGHRQWAEDAYTTRTTPIDTVIPESMSFTGDDGWGANDDYDSPPAPAPAAGLREALLSEIDDWATGRRSWTNLGPNPPYTPDVIAVMDAQEVVKRQAQLAALLDSDRPGLDVDAYFARHGHEPYCPADFIVPEGPCACRARLQETPDDH